MRKAERNSEVGGRRRTPAQDTDAPPQDDHAYEDGTCSGCKDVSCQRARPSPHRRSRDRRFKTRLPGCTLSNTPPEPMFQAADAMSASGDFGRAARGHPAIRAYTCTCLAFAARRRPGCSPGTSASSVPGHWSSPRRKQRPAGQGTGLSSCILLAPAPRRHRMPAAHGFRVRSSESGPPAACRSRSRWPGTRAWHRAIRRLLRRPPHPPRIQARAPHLCGRLPSGSIDTPGPR